jgi:hypothetical protein
MFSDRASWYKLIFLPTWCTISLFCNICITLDIWTCFRHYYAHPQELKIVFLQHLVSSLWKLSEWSYITKITSALLLKIYKITCNTCHKSYVGQTSRNLNLRFREHVRCIKNNYPRSAYALHILNCRHEYGNINDTMTLLKQINKPSLLLPYEQMYIQIFRRNNEHIPEQHPNEHNPMFELL